MVLEGLRELHTRMRARGFEKFKFHYLVRKHNFTIIFIASAEPYELSITMNAANIFILFEVHRGYRISPGIDSENYKALANLFKVHGESYSPFQPVQFIKELDNFMHGYDAVDIEPSEREIVEARNDLPEREKPFFFDWWDNDKVGKSVDKDNLTKTRVILGEEAARYSMQHNMSSCWTANEKKARNWRNR